MGCDHDQNHDRVRCTCLGHPAHARRASYRSDHHEPGGTQVPLVSCGLPRQLCRPRSVIGRTLARMFAGSRCWSRKPCLFLYQFELFGLEQLLGDALGAGLGTQAEVPQLFAEGCGVLVEKSSQLDLEGLDIGLEKGAVSTCRLYLCYGAVQLTNRDPSIRLKHSSITTSSSLPRISEILPAIHLATATRQWASSSRQRSAGAFQLTSS